MGYPLVVPLDCMREVLNGKNRSGDPLVVRVERTREEVDPSVVLAEHTLEEEDFREMVKAVR